MKKKCTFLRSWASNGLTVGGEEILASKRMRPEEGIRGDPFLVGTLIVRDSIQ